MRVYGWTWQGTVWGVNLALSEPFLPLDFSYGGERIDRPGKSPVRMKGNRVDCGTGPLITRRALTFIVPSEASLVTRRCLI